MQCDNPNTAIHIQLCLLAKKKEIMKVKNKSLMWGEIQRFMINMEPGTRMPHSIDTMSALLLMKLSWQENSY